VALHHRITANGHARMWAASPFTILFTTCRQFLDAREQPASPQ